MTPYCHVSRRLLIKQNTHGLFCEFRTAHCLWTCLCVCKSATYSSKLPLWHLYLLVRQLVGTWAKQKLGPFVMAHLHTAPPQRPAPGEWPHRGLAPSALLPAGGVGLASCTTASFAPSFWGSVLRYSDVNNKGK